jgi:hypothetical protein
MILNEGQPEAWRVHTIDDASPTLYAERPPAILRSIKKRKYDLMFPLDFAGTLCARDGIKTGPHSPNGEDAYDRKLVVMRMRRKKSQRFYSNHQSTSDVLEVDVAPCMGASRNLGPSNNNPLVVTCYSSPQDHCVSRGYMEECAPTLNAAAGMSGNNRPFIVRGKKTNVIPINSMVIGKLGDNGDRQTFGVGEVDDPSPTLSTAHHHAVAITTKRKATAVLDRCGNNWKNGKGGCGPLMHEEYAPTLATMFQPFVIKRGKTNA